jgi:EAL domain-containing protein (putative c-di-GMP-specific phosphodiesterase class I)
MLGRILVVDDEAAVQRMLERILSHAGHEVRTAGSSEEALHRIDAEPFDMVLTDLQMPGGSGLDLLRAVRARALDLPVVFLTGQPSVASAAGAVEHGAFRYLLKPISSDELMRAVRDALHARSLVRAADPMRHRRELDRSFQSALESLWIAFQPILSSDLRQTYGFEALMRSREPSLPSPGAILDAAEKLGSLHVLGRTVRRRAAAAIDSASRALTFFVNVHPVDLADADFFDPEAPLSKHAQRVVLEITERTTLEGIAELEGRLAKLRALGYRIAVDDLGAGYAGLSYFASLRPDLVKIDMSLVRGIDQDPVKQRVVLALANLGRSMGIEVVGEGVETIAERDMLVRLQCTHLQGFLFAKPDAPFPSASWG